MKNARASQDGPAFHGAGAAAVSGGLHRRRSGVSYRIVLSFSALRSARNDGEPAAARRDLEI